MDAEGTDADSTDTDSTDAEMFPGDVVVPFPTVVGRDLLGHDVVLPDELDGDPRVVILAFRQWQQRDVDSWVPWLQEQADGRPTLRVYELPAISGLWSPTRRFIDGGMAAAIRDREVLARTVTFYGDLKRLTVPLGIDHRDTIRVFVLDRGGEVAWSRAGAFSEASAGALAGALDDLATRATEDVGSDTARSLRVERSEFEWNPRFAGLLAALGVRPSNAHLTVTADRLVVAFGPWVLDTPLSNVLGTRITGGYAWYKAIGARLSLADRGVTFGTDTVRGLCICFREPVPALFPCDTVRHPAVTVTVAEPARLAAVIEERIT